MVVHVYVSLRVLTMVHQCACDDKPNLFMAGYVKSSAQFMYESTCACRDHIHDSYSANEIAPFRNVTRTCVIMCMRFIFHDTCMHEVPCECQKKQTNQQVS